MKIRPGFSRWLATSTLALFELTLCAAADPARKPNIIFILADDYGIGEVGCYGADHYQDAEH